MNFAKKKDVLIIGGGAIGLSLARALHLKGVKKIIVLERGKIGREASFAAAGMLAPRAEANREDDFFRFCVESCELYPRFSRQLLEETGIDIEFDQSGTLFTAFTEADVAEIRKRADWQTKAGLQVERLTAREVRKIEPFVSPDVREALFFPRDWQVENRRLLAALHKYAVLNGIETIENREVENLLIENGRAVGAETVLGKFFAEKTILATGAWTSLIKAGENVLSLPPVKPIRGQIISFHTAKRLLSKVIYSPRGYLVPRADGRILAGATVEDAGFDKTVTKGGVDFLLENALEIAPSLVNLQLSEKCAGLRPFAADGLPVLGAISETKNLFTATAHFRNGILLAPLTAQILADKIAADTASEYLDFFSPRRFQTAKSF